MSLNRKQYYSLLNQVSHNIIVTEQYLTNLKIQEKVSQLFYDLNDEPKKEVFVPASMFLNTILISSNFFKCEKADEITLSIRKVEDYYFILSKEYVCYFTINEFKSLCKDVEWDSEGSCKVKVACYRVSAAWRFSD